MIWLNILSKLLSLADWLTERIERKELMEAGDWKSINSVQKYIHIEPTEAKKLADNLPELSGAKSVQK